MTIEEWDALPPHTTVRFVFTNPPALGSHAYLFPADRAVERQPITIGGRSGWVTFKPVGGRYGEDVVLTLEGTVVFDPPLALETVMVMAGAEVR